MFVCLSKPLALIWGSQVVLVLKNLPTNARDTGSIPGLGRFPGGGHGNPLKYTCLENPMDRGAWQESMGLQRVRHDWSDSARKNTFIHHIPWLSFAGGAIVPCTHPTLGPCTPSLLLCSQGKFQIRHIKGMQDLQCTHPSTHSEDTWRLRLRLCSAYWVKHVTVLGRPCRLEAVLDQPPPRGIWHWHCLCVSGHHHVGEPGSSASPMHTPLHIKAPQEHPHPHIAPLKLAHYPLSGNVSWLFNDYKNNRI